MSTAETTSEPSNQTPPLLEVEGLHVYYQVKMSLVQWLLTQKKQVVHAVDGVSFNLRPGEIFGIVGESGSGKTTLGRAILRLVEPTHGRISFDGIKITQLPESQIRKMRTQMQIVFQDPHASLPPTMTIGRAIGHPLLIHHVAKDERTSRKEVLSVMREVGLTPELQLYDKYPSDLSGGQKQRAVIARAMILRPKLIIADEPVAMLDMSIRARVLELMLQLQKKYGLTILYITHDLATAKLICDRIGIMYLGRLVEIGNAKDVYLDPKHPYTRALLEAIPVPDPDSKRRKTLPRGEVPDAISIPRGCRFHPRCPVAFAACGWEGRDFINYLEERRLLPEKVNEKETNLGPITAWWAKGLTAGRPLGKDDPETLVNQVRNVLAEAPRPMAQAIRQVRIDENSVMVEFQEPEPVDPRHVDGRIVECLLY